MITNAVYNPMTYGTPRVELTLDGVQTVRNAGHLLGCMTSMGVVVAVMSDGGKTLLWHKEVPEQIHDVEVPATLNPAAMVLVKKSDTEYAWLIPSFWKFWSPTGAGAVPPADSKEQDTLKKLLAQRKEKAKWRSE